MHRSRLVAAALCALPGLAGAQTARADSLLHAGALARAESLYYAGVRTHPGDPGARLALGRYLVARGAPRVGATLLEEAIRFGGDRPAIERELAPLYLSMAEYHLLAALAAAPAPEKERAKWLVAHETRTVAPDSLVGVAFHPSADSSSLGHIPVHINGRAFEAAVSPRAQGIIISDAAAGTLHLHVFVGPGSGDRSAAVLGTADSLAMGALTIRNVPVSIARLAARETVEVGLDMLAKFSPTFDPRAGHAVLRVGAPVSQTLIGDRLPTLGAGLDFRVLQPGGWVSITSPAIGSLLRDHRWTLDARRGQLVIER